MPTTLAASLLEIGPAVSNFIRTTGYTEAGLKQLELTKTPWHDSSARHLLSNRLSPGTPLNLLVRLFFFGEPVPWVEALNGFSAEVTDKLSALGLVRHDNDQCIPEVMLVHYNDFLLACDSVRRAQAGDLEDLVLGVNRPTQILASCILPLPDLQYALDLGTGCGTLGLQLATRAKHVIGTDINERALDFAVLNAALNNTTNFEVRNGDRFEPVRDQRFDLIISNPPFFLTRSSKMLFTDNPFTLDSFVESLARQVPTLLKEGGYFQMLCEWVEIKGQPWHERIQDWFRGSPCDILVLKDYEIAPADYTLLRASEASSLQGPATEADVLDHMKYFTDKGVERIYGGLVTIRRSSEWPNRKPRSRNWFVVDETGGKPHTPIGDLILERFANEDVLSTESDSRLLAAKPRLSRGVTLVQESIQQDRSWKRKIIYLERRTDLPRKLGFDDVELAEIIGQWDGSKELDFHAAVFARRKNLPKTQVVPNFVRFARKLASLGLITFSAQ
jgi:hypothetical protein